ncbi:protein kinase, partial [Ramlibacter sp.]|uniref:protein kinase domain-containing protein n=1 Tax=Ramlibacter sp. TaxID=1917967 RepID=UPI0035B11B29
HRQNVVHRDIKPANIMYELDSDTVKVTDFGIARITDSSKTKTGLVLGTPSFMSPEQIAGKKVDGRSDLYSLGVMLFQMLTGVLPFRGDSMAELMYKIANEEAPDIRIIRRDLPERLAQIVAFSLHKKPESRYQDGDQFAAELRAVMEEMSGGAAPAAAGRPAGATAAMRIPAPAAPAAPAGMDKTAAFQSQPAAEKTAVFTPPAPPPAQAQPPAYIDFAATQPAGVLRPVAPAHQTDFPATQPASAARPPVAAAPGYAATVPSGHPQFAQTAPAAKEFAQTAPAALQPGYDAGQNKSGGGAPQGAQFDKTAVMSKPEAGVPPAGNGPAGRKP